MSKRRLSGPGRKVSTGHLRVDTARAVKKLREYQLAEPETWVLEVLRAAITLGATRIHVEGDAGDIVVRWEGGLLDDETMRTVLDELVNPGAARHDGAIRRLATGLNTALGPARVFSRHALPPRHVDLIRTDAGGQRTRVRYTSELLDSEDADNDRDDGLLTLVAEPAASAPAGAPAGMEVHLERHTLHTFVRFLGRAEPDELRAVRECADDVPVPLHIGGDVLHCDDSVYDLVRVPLGEGLNGFVALVDVDSIATGNQPAWVDFAERGVILAREPLRLSKEWREPRVSLPIRVMLDRQALPTNASRSAVRMDGALRSALDVAEKRVPALLTELHRLLQGPNPDASADGDPSDAGRPNERATPSEPNAPRDAERLRHHRLRKSALQLVAAHVRGRPWRFHSKTMPAELLPLMELPLLRDALGTPRSAAHFGDFQGLVYRGATPLREDIYGDMPKRMPFVPLGDAAALLLPEDAYDQGQVTRVLAAAEASGRAKAAFLRTATTSASVPSSDNDAWLAVPVGATRSESLTATFAAPATDIEGEVALYASRGTPRGRVTLLHEGRPVEDLLLPGPCSYRAVVACPRLTPRPDYRGVERDAVLEEVLAAVARALLVAAEVAARLERGRRGDVKGVRMLPAAPAPGALPAEHTRALLAVFLWAISGAAGAPTDASANTPEAAAPSADTFPSSPLAQARLVTVLMPSGEKRLECVVDLVLRARITRALLYRSDERGDRGVHPLAVLSDSAATPLAALADVPAAHVDPIAAAMTGCPRLPAEVALRVTSDSYVAEVGWGGAEDSWTVFRDGVALEPTEQRGRLLPIQAYIDDPRVVVDGRSRRVVLSPDHAELLVSLESALVAALVASVRGERPAGLRVTDARAVTRQLFRAMALAPRPFRQHFSDEFAWLEDNLEVPTALGTAVRLETLRKRRKVWWLPPNVRLDFEDPDFEPVCVDSEWRRWLRSVLRQELHDGAEALHEYSRRARGKRQRDRILAQAAAPEPTVDADDAFARRVRRGEIRGVLRADSGPTYTLRLTVTGRPLFDLATPNELPLSGQLDIPDALLDPAWDRLSASGAASLESTLRDELGSVIQRVAQEQPLKLRTALGERLVTAWGDTKSKSKSDTRVREALTHAPAWKSIQGEHVSVLQAKHRRRIQCAVFEGEWLKQRKGERKSAYDNAVIAVSAPASESALSRYLACVEVGDLHDVTSAAQQLQARRRVEQGKSERPRLGHADAVSIAQLCKDEPRLRTSLGPGEARLAPEAEGSNPSTARLHAHGRVVATCALPVFPPVEVAFEGSGYLDPAQPDRVEQRQVRVLTQRVQALSALLVAHAFEGEPSPTLRRSVRDAWLLHGTLADDVAAGAPVLQTTADAWTSLAEVQAAHTDKHKQWYTKDATCRVVPEDASRSALRLTPVEANALASKAPLEDVTQMLALQPVRLANKARPKATTLDAREALAALTPRAKASTLGFAEFEPRGGGGARGTLVLLTPDAAAHAGLQAHRAMHPLGTHPCPLPWPTLALVDNGELTPNDRYDGPKADAAWQATLDAVVSAAETALAARFDAGDDFGAYTVNATLPSGTLCRGVVRLGDPLRRGELSVGDAHLQSDVPLTGELWLCLPPNASMRHVVSAIDARTATRNSYSELARALADALSTTRVKSGHPPFARRVSSWSAEERDLAQGHVVAAALAGLLARKHVIQQQLRLTCFRESLTLREACALATGRDRVWLVKPGEHDALPDTTPVLFDDGSWSARVLAQALSSRLRPPPRQRSGDHATDTHDAAPPSDAAAGRAAPSRASSARRDPHHALPRLRAELSSLLAQAGSPPALSQLQVVVSPRRTRPLATLGPTAETFVLAGAAPVLRAIEQALSSGEPFGTRGAVALAAHALAVTSESKGHGARVDQLATLAAWIDEKAGM